MSTTIIHLDEPRVKIDLEDVNGPDGLILLTITDDENTVLCGIKKKDLPRLSHALGMAGEKIARHVASEADKARAILNGEWSEPNEEQAKGRLNRSETERYDSSYDGEVRDSEYYDRMVPHVKPRG